MQYESAFRNDKTPHQKLPVNVDEIRAAGRAAWRRKREFGWPVLCRPDGSVDVYLDEGLTAADFLADQERWGCGSRDAFPRHRRLTNEDQIKWFLNTHGSSIMIVDSPPFSMSGDYLQVQVTTGAVRFQADAKQTEGHKPWCS